MARKQKGQEAPAKDGPILVTYIGDLAAVSYMGVGFTRGVPLAVADASPYLNRTYFEVSRGDVLPR